MRKILRSDVKYYPDFANFVDEICKDYADMPAVSWYDRKKQESCRSFKEMTEDINALRNRIDDLGLTGKHLAIVGENSYQWLLVYMAAASGGSVAVCIDSEQPAEVIEQMLMLSDADAVFVSEASLEIGEAALKKDENRLRQLFVLDGHSDKYECVTDIVSDEKNRMRREWKADVYPEKTAALVFTSGTTGLSKPVMLSHQALLTNACECNIYVNGGVTAFSALPFCHTYGMTCAVLATWARGAKLILNGNLKTLMRDLRMSGAFSILTVPLIVESIHNQIWLKAEQTGKDKNLKKLFKLEKFKRTIGINKVSAPLEELKKSIMGDLKVIICGGAHLSKEISEEFTLMGLIVLQGYGITECSPLVAVNGNEACKLGSVGMVLPSCEVRLENEEILVRGKTVMNGYYKMPEETENCMDGEWFRTGDLGEFDSDGFLYITGRIKNLIVFKNGKKISPERLEEKISKCPLVGDVMVYGAISGVSADDVKLAASVYPDKERTKGMTSYEILEELQEEINRLNDTLPLYQQIQMVNIRKEEFDKTAMMKIKRHLV